MCTITTYDSCFFFSSRRRHTRYIGDWSSDVCSSDLDLIVFPSASEIRPDMGVKLVSIQGRYRSGINAEEASAMVEAALRFMHTDPNRSLGIVTLNQKQRDLLLEQMEDAL